MSSTKNAVLVCERCNGTLIVDETKTVAMCPYCQTAYSVSALLNDSDNVKIARIQRDVMLGAQNLEAERLRQADEREKAKKADKKRAAFGNGAFVTFTLVGFVYDFLMVIVCVACKLFLPVLFTVISIVSFTVGLLMGYGGIREKFTSEHIIPGIMGAFFAVLSLAFIMMLA